MSIIVHKDHESFVLLPFSNNKIRGETSKKRLSISGLNILIGIINCTGLYSFTYGTSIIYFTKANIKKL